jgi:trehalose 6-phosphate synthase
MRRLRRSIRDSDIFWWVDSFLRAAIAKDLSAFPQPEGAVAEAVPDYVPI